MEKEMKKRIASIIKNTTLDGTGPSILTHHERTSFTDPVVSTTHIWMARGFPII
jgi:hypothetical protein